MLSSIITSKTRIRLLTKFFLNPSNVSYLRELAKEFDESTNAVRKELNNLSEAGLLETDVDQNKKTYRANTQHPLFLSIHQIVKQSLGLESLVDFILRRMGDVDKIIVVGDYAMGLDTGQIDVVIIGQDLDKNFMGQISESVEKKIERKVNIIKQNNHSGPGFVVYDKRIS